MASRPRHDGDFDGWRDGHPLQHDSQSRGVRVIYAQRGEQADDVIRRMASHVAHQGIVVTSDRGLADTLARLGADVTDSKTLGMAPRCAARWGEGQGAKQHHGDWRTDTRVGAKKGRARHPSRAAPPARPQTAESLADLDADQNGESVLGQA